MRKNRDFWRATLLVMLFLVGSMSRAADAYHSAQVKFVYPQGNGQTIVIGFATDPPACQGAANPKYFYVTVGQNGVTADGLKYIFATALAALALEKTLGIAYDDSTPYCYVNRVSVERG